MCILFIVSGGNKRRIRQKRDQGLGAWGHGVTDDLPVPNGPGGPDVERERAHIINKSYWHISTTMIHVSNTSRW